MAKRQSLAKKPQRFNYITFISVISAFSVVLIHVNSYFSFSYSPRWAIANIARAILTYAVPVFFMISGVTLIDYRKRYDTKTYLKKRFTRTVIPFLFWGIMAILMHRFWLHDLPLEAYQPFEIVNRLINAMFIPVFWFFIPLFILYLTIPILGAIDEQKRRQVFRYIILVSLVFNFIIPAILNLAKIPIESPIKFTTTSCAAIFYAVVGYYIHTYEISKKARTAIYIFGIIGVLATIIGTHILSYNAGELTGFMTDYDLITYAAYSPAVFLFMKSFFSKHFTSKKSKVARLANFFSRYTFPLYLTHWFPIVFLSIWTGNAHNQWWYALVMTPLCVIIAIISTKIFSKNVLP